MSPDDEDAECLRADLVSASWLPDELRRWLSCSRCPRHHQAPARILRHVKTQQYADCPSSSTLTHHVLLHPRVQRNIHVRFFSFLGEWWRSFRPFWLSRFGEWCRWCSLRLSPEDLSGLPVLPVTADADGLAAEGWSSVRESLRWMPPSDWAPGLLVPSLSSASAEASQAERARLRQRSGRAGAVP